MRPMYLAFCLCLSSLVAGVQQVVPTRILRHSLSGPGTYIFNDVSCGGFDFTATSPDEQLSCDTVIHGANVHIEDGGAQGDWLACDACHWLLIAEAYIQYRGVLRLSGDRSINDYAAALASVRFFTTETTADSRRIRYTLGDTYVGAEKEQFYILRSFPTDQVNCLWDSDGCRWDAAQADCANPANDFFGLVGYLATPTTQEQLVGLEPPQGYAGGQAPMAWLGCTDVGDEGVFRWVVGPHGCPEAYNISRYVPENEYFTRSACDLGYPLMMRPPCYGGNCRGGTRIDAVPGAVQWAAGEPDDDHSGPGSQADTGEDFCARSRTPGSEGIVDEALFPGFGAMYEYVCQYQGVGVLLLSAGDVTRVTELLLAEHDECMPALDTALHAPHRPKQCSAYPLGTEVPLFPRQLACSSYVTSGCTCASREFAAVSVVLDEHFAPGDTLRCTGGCVSTTNEGDLMPEVHGGGKRVLRYTVRHDSKNDPTLSDLIDLLNRLNWRTTSQSLAPRRVSWSFGAALYVPETGSWYASFMLPDSPGTKSWASAQALCAASRHGALSGFLATFTTPLEAAIATADGASRDGAGLEVQFWAGGTDVGTEGYWRWVTGPEGCPGDTMCSLLPIDHTVASGCGGADCDGGTLFLIDRPGMDADQKGYSDFAPGEPDNLTPALGPAAAGSGSAKTAGQDFLSVTYLPSGISWADEAGDAEGVTDYICEYSARVNVGVAATCLTADHQHRMRGVVCIAPETSALPSHSGSNRCGVGQWCVDPSPTDADRGDWECQCLPPLSGLTVAGPAVCELDECVPGCSSCISAFGCLGSQICADGNKSAGSLGDWACLCVAPAMSTAGPVPLQNQSCTLNECTNACDTCIAPWHCYPGQTCLDQNTDFLSLGDWVCTCDPPFFGAAPMRNATCSIDECVPHAACATCISEYRCADGQACLDADFNAANDWECICAPPRSGAATAANATCAYDECGGAAAARTCREHGQVCRDPDLIRAGDWVCDCVGPATRVGLPAAGEAAVCRLPLQRDCATDSRSGICAEWNQTCVDNLGTAGGWLCVCADGRTATGQPVGNCTSSDAYGWSGSISATSHDASSQSTMTPAATPSPPMPPGELTTAPEAGEVGAEAPPPPPPQRKSSGLEAAGVPLAVLLAAGGCAVPAAQLVLVASDCERIKSGYPTVLHPTQMEAFGSYALGAVVGNAAIIAAAGMCVWGAARVAAAVRGCPAGVMAGHTSVGLAVLLCLYQGLTLGALQIVLVRSDLVVIAGCGVMILCCAVPVCVLRAVQAHVPTAAYYDFDTAPLRPPQLFLIGPGEWVRRTRECDWAERWGCTVVMYRQPFAWYLFIELAAAFTLSVVHSVPTPLEASSCGHVKAASAAVCFLIGGVELYHFPHCLYRNNFLDGGAKVISAVAAACLAGGYYSDGRARAWFGAADALFSAALVLLFVQAALDVLRWVYVRATGRQRRLQNSAFQRNDRPAWGETAAFEPAEDTAGMSSIELSAHERTTASHPSPYPKGRDGAPQIAHLLTVDGVCVAKASASLSVGHSLLSLPAPSKRGDGEDAFCASLAEVVDVDNSIDESWDTDRPTTTAPALKELPAAGLPRADTADAATLIGNPPMRHIGLRRRAKHVPAALSGSFAAVPADSVAAPLGARARTEDVLGAADSLSAFPLPRTRTADDTSMSARGKWRQSPVQHRSPKASFGIPQGSQLLPGGLSSWGLTTCKSQCVSKSMEGSVSISPLLRHNDPSSSLLLQPQSAKTPEGASPRSAQDGASPASPLMNMRHGAGSLLNCLRPAREGQRNAKADAASTAAGSPILCSSPALFCPQASIPDGVSPRHPPGASLSLNGPLLPASVASQRRDPYRSARDLLSSSRLLAVVDPGESSTASSPRHLTALSPRGLRAPSDDGRGRAPMTPEVPRALSSGLRITPPRRQITGPNQSDADCI